MASAFSSSFVPRASAPVDPLDREAKEIDRRRERLEDRRKRVLHAKTRLIGVDVDALDQQVRDKHREQLELAAEQSHYDSLTACHNGQINQLIQKKQEADLESRYKLAFHHQQQAAEKKSRELFNQERSRSPINVETNFLSFTGEDLLQKERIKAQQQQQRQWATEQIQLKMKQEEKEVLDQKDYEKQMEFFREIQKLNEEKKLLNQIQINQQIHQSNQILTHQKRFEKKIKKQMEEEENSNELIKTFNDSFLCEVSGTSGNPNTGFCFKGFPEFRKQQILDEQGKQMEEKQMLRELQRKEKKKEEEIQDSYQRLLILNQIKQQQQQIQTNQNFAQEHQKQTKEKYSRDQYLNTVVYTNPVKEEFFQQFGTSAR